MDQLLERQGLRHYWSRNRRRYADSFVAFISARLQEFPPAELTAALAHADH